MSAVKYVEEIIERTPDEMLVACESFVLRPGVRTWQPDALEIIGALRYVCLVHETEFTLQSAVDAKEFSTNEKLDRLGWRAKKEHVDDAIRHILLAATRRDLIDLYALVVSG